MKEQPQFDLKALKKAAPKVGSEIYIVARRMKEGRGLELSAYKVSSVQPNVETGELTLSVRPDLSLSENLSQRLSMATDIVATIEPQLEKSVHSAVTHSLARSYSTVKLKKIQSQIARTKQTSIGLVGKRGCMFLKVGDKKHKL